MTRSSGVAIYHWVDYPDFEREIEILRKRVPEATDRLSSEIVAFVHSLRGQDLFKSPGVAESIDWARCLVALDAVALSPELITDTLGALLKYQDDIARIAGAETHAASGRGAAEPLGRGMTPAVDHDAEGRLVENILHFTHALRKAGVKVGTAQVETAIRAVAETGFSRRIDFYHTLRATLITRAEHLEVFHQVFAMFWRDPDFLTSLMHMLSPQLEGEPERRKPDAGQRRAEEALSGAPQH